MTMEHQNTNHDENDATTIQREWHDLKPGDVIRLAGRWDEVFDAYPIAQNTVIVKLTIARGQIQTHRIRVNAGNKATCRA